MAGRDWSTDALQELLFFCGRYCPVFMQAHLRRMKPLIRWLSTPTPGLGGSMSTGPQGAVLTVHMQTVCIHNGPYG